MTTGLSISGMGRCLVAGVVAAVTCGSSAAMAGSAAPPNYGLDWATITHAGNAPWVGYASNGGPPSPTISWGDVGYEYRIAKTEVSNAQWLDFVRAAAPFMPANEQRAMSFTGAGIAAIGNQYILIEPGNWAARVGWRAAARFANWSHNGQKSAGVATAADFASGAYDISTFNYTGQIGITDQATRSPGAQFWIASIDEWVKAVYWDPNRYGAGQPGYWLFPGSQDMPLFTAPPPEGQTNMGAGTLGQPYTLQIGQYPNVTGPWGLLDVSGNVSEWLEDKVGVGRYTAQSDPSVSSFQLATADRINWKRIELIYDLIGVRLASAVPAPTTVAPWLCVPLMLSRRRRTCSRGYLSESLSH